MDKAELMTLAIQLRKDLGEDSSSPIDIFAIAKGIEGLSIVYYPMGDNLSGMCVKGSDNNCVIGINSGMSLGRQRFSLAHEFYHKYYDKTMVSLCGKKIGSGKGKEKEADLFASFFLMPNDELIKKTHACSVKNPRGNLTLSDIIRIEQFFLVSHKATVIRLAENRLITQSEADQYLQMSVRTLAESMGYDGDLYRALPPEKQYRTYGSYVETADRLLKLNLISEGKYESLLLDAFRPDLVYGETDGGDLID
ncbi:MAG: ImmA/IrrE family metallo-endopeptidase [Clostridia bacterium]|nr:ImmA/IrrE family metallo-endopeptidase [Clostridia bacterium]